MLFGGAHCHGRCQCFGDTWTFGLRDTDSKQWELYSVATEPITRYKQSAVLVDDVLYTFGGESYQPYMYHNSIQVRKIYDKRN